MHYPIENPSNLEQYFKAYIPLIKFQLDTLNIEIAKYGIKGDHLGLQVLSSAEFDQAHKLISNYSETIKEGVIHDRRNNTYKLNTFIRHENIELQSIEIFEPKPNADISKLKPGFEHIALKSENFDELLTYFKVNNFLIDKFVEFGGSKFFKTKFISLVEIEFRNEYLWKDLQKEIK